MGLLDGTASQKPNSRKSSKATRSTPPSSGPDSATLETIQNLRTQIADLEAKEEERGKLTTAQAEKLEALESELAALKNPTKKETSEPNTISEPAGRLAPWCPW